MSNIKRFIFISTLLLSQCFFAQEIDALKIYRKDFKSISGKNTVTVTSYEKNEKHLVYVGGFGSIDVFNLDKNGNLTPISNHELHMQKGPARGMVADNIKGVDFLFVANKHGNVIESFKILKNGSLKRVFLIEDTDEMHLGVGITLQVVHMKASSYLFVGGLEKTPGLTCLKIHKDGKLTHVQSIKDDETIHTDGIIGMHTFKIGEETFLYTGGFQDNGVSSFKVNEDGTFKNINNINDNNTDRFLTGAYPVTGVTLSNNHYIIVGHRHHKYYKRKGFIKKTDFVYHGDGVNIFKIGTNGALVPHSTFIDDKTTKLSGQTRIEVVSVNDNEAILAIGTRDDTSIQLCKLNKEGILTPISYLETGFSIYYGLSAHKIENNHFLIAGSNQFDLKKVVSYKVSTNKNNTSGKVLRHIVNLKFKENTKLEDVKKAVAQFENLKNKIPEIANIEWGPNDSTEGHSKGFSHCFSLTFNDEHGRETYLFHKAHLALVKNIGPLLADVLVMDYWVNK